MTERDYTTFETIDLTSEEVLQCSYSNWSKLFSNNIFPSKIIKPLPSTFLDYLASESIRLPSNTSNKKITVLEADSDNEYSDWDDDDDDDDDEGQQQQQQQEDVFSQFQDIQDKIDESIQEIGGAVFPKLNWSSPKDAKWIMPGNTIKCQNVSDVYLLLNSSDHIGDDLDNPFSEVKNKKTIPEEINYELVLTKWQDINPAYEFRVFIKHHQIIGISQRDNNKYEFLQGLKLELNEKITQFIDNVVIPKLKSNTQLNKYIVDIYVSKNHIYIIDINPFSRKSDSGLFTWVELLSENNNNHHHHHHHELRLVENQNFVKEFSESQVPIEVVGATMDTEAMVELAREWDKLQAKEK
ncbi:cell division cycle protein, putative [Candida dubliniensis CD36]|uniref:Translation initiation factor eIF2 assembly protein n=1 Tax=Candida dubliniensis (strain CD36 / ATCC MYA-646 / CBS 7987 / NCPF 3949 / NRRL Y-17841) TaxID=573826 RepID=B9WFX4_CANDC|nr:cell division cycle protein, putative [Candida dubliniensis CD36]CAX42143.1 cell division cycle protein, putative [Candida dubliniensis CD36]